VKTGFVGWFDFADRLTKRRDKGQLEKEWADQWLHRIVKDGNAMPQASEEERKNV
jgi:hypothetical protein